MLQDFHITHRRKPAIFSATTAPVWATCLRSLAFGSSNDPHDDDEIYQQDAAYGFLLEVVCGLKSPIAGETEVFGQFKQFSQEWVKAEPRRASLVQRVLTDAKAIRSEHLLDLGVQSYGSWVRHNVRGERVHFLGSGQMVREILPYLEKKGCQVSVHARQPEKCHELSARPLAAREFDCGSLIVAAPMTAVEIVTWLAGRRPEQIIDLRDNSSLDPIAVEVSSYRLADIFSALEKTKSALQPRLEAAQKAIQSCSARAASLSVVRPQGWDDICA